MTTLGRALWRLAGMFSVATLTLASPIYLRLVDGIGPWPLLRLVLLVQVGPALLLWGVDELVLRLAPARAWRAWRGVLYAAALLSVLRQTQASLTLPGNLFGIRGPIVIALAVTVVTAVVVLTFRALGHFFAAFAVSLLAWTIYVGSTLSTSSGADVPAPAGRATSAPVFVLLFDELDPAVFMRDGRVRAGWPGLTRLAGMSVSFSDATANYGDTCGSVSTLLTGRLLPEGRPPNNPRCFGALPALSPTSLFDDLARERAVHVYAQYLRYCFKGAVIRCMGTDLPARRPWLPLLQHWNPQGIPTGHRLVPPRHVVTLPLFEQFLGDITAGTAPGTASYLHLLLPHDPYVFEERGAVHPPSSFRAGMSAAAYEATLRDYVSQAHFVDRLVDRFVARLDAVGLTDRAIVILVSDHGLPSLEPFAAPRLVDGIDVNNARPRVTLMVHAPGLAPAVTAADYQHRDFRALVSAVLHGDHRMLTAWRGPGRVDGEKLFSFKDAWYVREGNGRWRPSASTDHPAGAASADASADAIRSQE